MTTPIIIVSALLTLGVLAFLGPPLLVWLAAAAVLLFFAGAPIWVWIPFGIVAAIFGIRPLRTRLVSTHVAATLRRLKLLPTISETERIALEAGTVWMDGELFSGHPNLKTLLAQPYPELRPDERAFLDGPVEEACRLTDDWRTHQEKDLAPEVWDFLKRERFFGLIIPKRYGGLELSALGFSAVVHKLASRSFPLSVTVMIPSTLGPAELLLHYGTDEQKDEYLPKLATGEHMPCFALTEPNAGSDAGSLASEGVVFRDADGELKLRLQWKKRYTSLAAVSTVVGLAFQLRDPDNLLGKGEDLGITCALVPSETPGVEITERHDPLGCPFYNCPTEGHDVVVPVGQIIGGPDWAGRGWQMLMECLAAGRGVALPAACAATGKMLARVTGAYATVRQQFGMSVGKFEGVEEPLARIVGMSYLLEAARVYTCGAIDAGAKPSVVSAIMKYHFTELSRDLVNDGMDVLAGAGISRGPRNLLANAYASAPIGITVEGANILTRSMIIYGQGAIRCHPWAQDEMKGLATGDDRLFDRAFWGHVGHMVRNGTRSKLLSLTRGRFARSPVSGPTAVYWRRLSWASATFAFVSDLAMISLGGDLKRREKLSGRMGDILSWMYLGAATLRRFEAEGRRAEDLPIVRWTMETVGERMQEAFDGVFRNFPVPFIGAILRGPGALWSRVNPIGAAPSDALGATLANLIRRPGEQRDRLTRGIYVPVDVEQALGRLENAFRLAVEADGVVRKIRDAIKAGTLPKQRPETLLDEAATAGVVSAAEAETVRAALIARDDATAVDSFPLERFAATTPTPGGAAPAARVAEPATRP